MKVQQYSLKTKTSSLKKLLVLSILSTSLFAGANKYEYKEWKSKSLYKADINVEQAYEMQKRGVVLVDIRTKREYEFKHPAGAVWIPIFFDNYGKRVLNSNFIEQIEDILNKDPNKKLLLIGKNGVRAKYAANMLANEGYKEVYNIIDGFLGKKGWLKNEFPYKR